MMKVQRVVQSSDHDIVLPTVGGFHASKSANEEQRCFGLNEETYPLGQYRFLWILVPILKVEEDTSKNK